MVSMLVEKDSRPPPALLSPILLKLPKDLRNGHLVWKRAITKVVLRLPTPFYVTNDCGSDLSKW